MQVNQGKDLLVLCGYVTKTRNCLQSCLEYQNTNVHLHFLVLIIIQSVPTIGLALSIPQISWYLVNCTGKLEMVAGLEF